MSRLFIDGDYTVAKAMGPILSSIPFPQDPATKIYRQKFVQFRANFAAQAISTAGPIAATYLVEETPLEKFSGGGLVIWERIWAHVPNDRTEREQFVYAYQYIETILHSDPNIPASRSIGEIAIPVDSTLTYSYELVPGVPDPARLPFKLVELSSGVNSDVFSNGGVAGLAEASVRRWKGNIYETVERTVPATMILAPA